MPSMTNKPPVTFPHEECSNQTRAAVARLEPKSLRTFTPSQAVFHKSAGVFHWTPEGRRLYDYSSGVLVANLGHNPRRWFSRFAGYMGWSPDLLESTESDAYFQAVTFTAYNALTELEAQATQRLCASLQRTPHGGRLEQVMWAASGSEAVQKALWACLRRDPERNLILATRHGFHGKKGLAGAVTGSENDPDRDPRVKFIAFPMEECDDIAAPSRPFDAAPYLAELDRLWDEFGTQISCLITEPYLGGGGSYHPPHNYLQLLSRWCRDHEVLFVLDEVQSNFGRTGEMYAFETYGVKPDFVCLGKGLGNGVPVSAAVGPEEILEELGYGATSDTWSANPISCAAVLATLDEFETRDVLDTARELHRQFVAGLIALKKTSLIAKVRGEGMVFGIECSDFGQLVANDVAVEIVKECYLGEPEGDGIHLLGPLAGNVIRVSPPMTMTSEEAQDSLALLARLIQRTADRLAPAIAVCSANAEENS